MYQRNRNGYFVGVGTSSQLVSWLKEVESVDCLPEQVAGVLPGLHEGDARKGPIRREVLRPEEEARVPRMEVKGGEPPRQGRGRERDGVFYLGEERREERRSRSWGLMLAGGR